MLCRFALAILAAALMILPVAAQIRATGAGAGFGIIAGTGSRATGHALVNGQAHFHQGNTSGRSLLLPYPYFYSDLDGSSYSQEAQPQVIVVPAAAPATPPAPAPPRQSLLIEWQGDRFVRTTMSANDSAAGQIAPDYSEKSVLPQSPGRRLAPGRQVATQPLRELPPAVLIFHDGRKEEVSEYTITSGIIYSKADYWTTGSWTRKIQISDLDVPATMKANQQRGLKFVLPGTSNEVITRP
jgi:hypothetical protein